MLIHSKSGLEFQELGLIRRKVVPVFDWDIQAEVGICRIV